MFLEVLVARLKGISENIIAELEDEFEVTVITQNGDDFHERAGSAKVIYLHGEALKNASTLYPYQAYEIDRKSPDLYRR